MPGRPAARIWLIALAAVLAALAWTVAPARPAGATGAATASTRARGLELVTQSYRLTRANEIPRLTAQCPGSKVPFGGGMTSSPDPGADGEGAYPQSYERLGVQHGWHITAVLYDPSAGSTTPRDVTVQVVCARKFGHVTPPHTNVHLNPGQTKSPVARCPGHRRLIGGGFQRTDFTANGGDYVTESRAISSKAWRVTGHAFGAYGGGLSAIAYCLHGRRSLVTAVSGSASIAPNRFGTATTPPCPAGRRLIFGGFSTQPGGSGLFTDGSVNPDGSWSASAFNRSGPAITLAAYGYCISA
jgi:hypothetical protein